MKFFKNIQAAILAGLSISACCPNSSRTAIPYDNEIEHQVDSILSGMTLEEKAGQMVQLTSETFTVDGRVDEEKARQLVRRYKIGSFLNTFGTGALPREETADQIQKLQEITMAELGIPMVYGLDMIHGASYLADATFFPQEINIAATFERSYAFVMGQVTGYESRAAMVPWVFSPVMDLSRNPCWPRVWESWGEDPYLQSEMAVAETEGAQGEDPNHIDNDHVAVSIKHYMAYGAAATGKDRTPAYIAPCDIREKYFRPFKESIRAGALTLMVNSASVNGVPVHASHEYLTEWVKEQLDWDGLIVTDWADINNLYTREHISGNRKEALVAGINAGIDMIMDPYDATVCDDIIAAVKEKLIPMSRIDDAVRRVLRLKARLNLFKAPVWPVGGYSRFTCDEFRDNAYHAAVESMVLLKNNGGVLPLKPGAKLLVTGPNANSMRTLNGGWSYTWQGDADRYASGFRTILGGLKAVYGENNVIYEPGVTYNMESDDWQEENTPDIGAAVRAAAGADVIIACVGENSYCETPGNIDDLNLSSSQKQLVKELAATGKPVVLVLNEGRPRIINDIEPLVQAVVDVMLPGNAGGDALAALLSGKENFSGKLPFTYSRHVNSLHTYDYKVSEHVQTMSGMYGYDALMDVQWPFGAGLSYTSFEYSALRMVSPSGSFKAGDELVFEVNVKNSGNAAGKESVLLFSSDLVASIVPDVKRLRQFAKVKLEPGESRVVRMTVPASDLAFVGADGKWRLEKGGFRISCGTEAVMVDCAETKVWDSPEVD